MLTTGGRQETSSEGCVLSLAPGAKELLSDDLAIILGQCAPKIRGQDVLIKLLEEAREVVSMDIDLQGSRGDRAEWGVLSGWGTEGRKGTGGERHSPPCLPDGVRLHSPPCRAVTQLRTTAQSLTRAQVGSPPPPTLIPRPVP